MERATDPLCTTGRNRFIDTIDKSAERKHQLVLARTKRKRSQAGVWLIFRRVFACFVRNVIAEKCA